MCSQPWCDVFAMISFQTVVEASVPSKKISHRVNVCCSAHTTAKPCRHTSIDAFQALTGLCDMYMILNLECCKCAGMRFLCANSLVVLHVCAPEAIGVRRGWHLPPGNRDTNQMFRFNSCNDRLFSGMTLTLHKSHMFCSGMMTWCLQFTHVRSLACRGRLRNLGTDFSYVGLYCVSITRQYIFKGSFQVAAIGILPSVVVECRHLGR